MRRDLAIAYLHGQEYSITDIALLLGYSESSAFTRAFRRWYGQTPQQFRRALGQRLSA